ncbi:hypothetical protein RB195_002981 [Necator americanus]|uniref:Uncharacterized protein n=1 Tax=Necator americanus TaxID=51031 RepID=A0ABR1DN04_NECAM
MATGQQRPYRLTDVLGGLSDLISRRRSPSLSRKKRKETPATDGHRKGSAPASLNHMFVPIVELVVASADSPGGSMRSGASVSPMRQVDDRTKTPTSSAVPIPATIRIQRPTDDDENDGKHYLLLWNSMCSETWSGSGFGCLILYAMNMSFCRLCGIMMIF